MTTAPDRPKGAMTGTAARSKWFFWAGVGLAVVWLLLIVSDGGNWNRWLGLTVWLAWVVLLFRSWRILQRFEAQQ